MVIMVRVRVGGESDSRKSLSYLVKKIKSCVPDSI